MLAAVVAVLVLLPLARVCEVERCLRTLGAGLCTRRIGEGVTDYEELAVYYYYYYYL
jgi:hypothetical protein